MASLITSPMLNGSGHNIAGYTRSNVSAIPNVGIVSCLAIDRRGLCAGLQWSVGRIEGAVGLEAWIKSEIRLLLQKVSAWNLGLCGFCRKSAHRIQG